MTWTSAGAPLGWHLKDGRALQWINGETQAMVAGLERGVAQAKAQIEKDPKKADEYIGPYKITPRDQLRDREVLLSQAKNPKWDYVFLLFFTDDYQVDDAEIAQRVKTLTDAVKMRGATPIVWLPWGGVENLKRYTPLAKDLKVTLVPTSFAEQLNRSGKLSEKTEVRWGGGHPNARVTYLYACMFYGAMFNKSPEGLPVTKIRGYSEKEANLELTPEEAARLQRTAWQALQEYRKLEATATKQ